VLVRVFLIVAVLEIEGVTVRVIADESDGLTVPVIVLHSFDYESCHMRSRNY
jgi:hypothetical protein